MRPCGVYECGTEAKSPWLFCEDHRDGTGKFKSKPAPDAGRNNMSDAVNTPKHYAESAVETIEGIEAWKLDFHLGNVVKYISRAGKKDPAKEIEDLEKAWWYLSRALHLRECAKLGCEPLTPKDMPKRQMKVKDHGLREGFNAEGVKAFWLNKRVEFISDAMCGQRGIVIDAGGTSGLVTVAVDGSPDFSAHFRCTVEDLKLI